MPEAEDQLIVVNERNEILGSDSKSRCHAGRGVLHRGFSVYIFDRAGRLLIQQRSEQKPLWPLYWSNSCCSHPRWGEEEDHAAHRRVREELGLEAPLRLVSSFRYHADFESVGSEHEICSVYIGVADGTVVANPQEVADWRFIGCEQLDSELSNNAGVYTPWFQRGWRGLRSNWSAVEAL